jgi:hypothetical protein
VRARAAVLAAALATAIAGCGGDDGPSPASEGASPTTPPPATTTTGTDITDGSSLVTTSTVPTTTTPTATTGVPPGGVTTGESGAGGAGDEEAVRVPVALIAHDGALTPTTVTVPAFLALEVTIASPSAATTATLPGGATLAVPARGKATKRLGGLKAGDYTVTTSAGGKTTLHVVDGGDPGP